MTRAAAVAAGLLVALGASPALAQPEDEAPPSTHAIVHATLWTGEGEPVEDATVVLRDGRIVAAGAGVSVPGDATVVDAEGGVVTYGLIATQTSLGLVEISMEEETRDASNEAEDADAVRAAFTAADGYNPRSTLVAVARRQGVLSAVSTPEGGLVPGASAFVDLDGETPDDTVARRVTALHVSLNESGVRSAGGAMPVALTRLRELFDDARLYARQRSAFDRRALREMSVSRLDLERVAEALAGRLPVVIKVSRAADILRALELGEDLGLRLVLAGCEEGWRVADAIAAADVPVIVRPHQNLPSTFARLGTRFDNAARLAAAGVRLVLSPGGPHDVGTLRQEVGNAIAWGLPRDVALRAVTSEPARVFGVERDYGRLARGQVGNVVIWSGDPFELTTWPTHAFVRGRPVSLRSRQTALFERYRDLGSVPRGWPEAAGEPAAAPEDE